MADPRDTTVEDWLKTPQSGQTYMTTPPTSARGGVRNKALDLASLFGASKYGAQDFADFIGGNSAEMGLADIAPGLGTYMGAEEGIDAYNRGDTAGAAAGALGTALSFLPVVGPLASKGVREGAAPAARAFLGDEFGGVPLPGVKPDPTRKGTGDLFYSQAEKTLQGLGQNKGTIEQFRAQMLKGGVKPDELLWSGFDQKFSDPKQPVSRMDLEEHFANAPLPTNRTAFQATGKTGDDTFDENSAYDSFYHGELYDGTLQNDIRDEFIADLEATHPTVGALREGSPEEYARLLEDYDLDDLGDDALVIEGVPVSDLGDYVDDNLRGEISNTFDDRVRANWDDWGRESDREALEDAGFFDPGTTKYSENFTKGAEDYQEALLNVNPESRRLAFGAEYDPGNLYPGGHFGQMGRDLAVHTRSGTLPRAEDGAKVYHLGEIQSDYAQRNRGSIRSPEQERSVISAFSDLPRLEAEAGAAEDRLRDIQDYALPPRMAPSRVKDTLTDPNLSRYNQQAMLDAYARTGQDVSPLQYSRGQDHGFRTPPHSWGTIPESISQTRMNLRDFASRTGEPTYQMGLGDIEQVDEEGFVLLDGLSDDALLSELNSTPNFPRGDREPFSIAKMRLSGETPRNTNHPGIADYFGEKARRNSAYHGTSPDEPALPLGYTDEQVSLADALAARNSAAEAEKTTRRTYNEARKGTVPAAPFVGSTEKFTDVALKDALADAMAGDFDFLTLGSPQQAQDMTYMPEDAAENFYGKLVPKQMQKLLDKVAPGHKLEPVRVDADDSSTTVLGVRLTPELRDAVRKNGIPIYSLGGGMVALGGAFSPEDQQGY